MQPLQRIKYKGASYALVTDLLEHRVASLITAAMPTTQEEWQRFASTIVNFYEGQMVDLDDFGKLLETLKEVRVNAQAIEDTADKLNESNSIADAPAFLAATKTFEQEMTSGLLANVKKAQRAITRVFKLGKQHRKLKKKIQKERQRSPEL